MKPSKPVDKTKPYKTNQPHQTQTNPAEPNTLRTKPNQTNRSKQAKKRKQKSKQAEKPNKQGPTPTAAEQLPCTRAYPDDPGPDFCESQRSSANLALPTPPITPWPGCPASLSGAAEDEAVPSPSMAALASPSSTFLFATASTPPPNLPWKFTEFFGGGVRCSRVAAGAVIQHREVVGERKRGGRRERSCFDSFDQF